MRPQVPIDRSKTHSDQSHSWTERWTSPIHDNQSLESSLPLKPNSANRWKAKTKAQAREWPRSLDGILATNSGALREIRNYEQLVGSIGRFESLSVSSSFDMARAQANPEHKDNECVPPPQEYHHQQLHRRPMTVKAFSKSMETASPTNLSPSSITEEGPRPRTLEYWDKERQKEERDGNWERWHTNVDSLDAGRLSYHALADNVASPNSVSENKRPVAIFGNNTYPTQSYRPSAPPTQVTPFRCHGASSSFQPEQPTQALPPAKTISILDMISPANLWKTCSPAIPPLQDDERKDHYTPSFRISREISEQSSEKDSARGSYEKSADVFGDNTRHNEMVERHRQHQPEAYEQIINWSHPALLDGTRDATRRAQQSPRVGTPHKSVSHGSYNQISTSRISTPDVRNRQSPTMSQIREDLWGHSVDGQIAPIAPDNAGSPTRALSQRHASAYPFIDDFDPFDIGCLQKTTQTQDQIQTGCTTPRMSNNRLIFSDENATTASQRHSSLEPCKRDTKPRRKRSTSVVGPENNRLHSRDPLVACATNTKTNGGHGSHLFSDQDSGDHSKNGKWFDESGGIDKIRHHSGAQQSTLRNYEMLRSMERGSDHVDAEILRQPTLPLNSKSRPFSVTRKALKYDVGKLENCKKTSNAANVYVAYLRFGPNPTEILQLCEHPVRADAKSKNGEVPLKVLASSISTTDCEIRRGEWTSILLDPYIIPGASLVGVVGRMEQKKRCCFKEGDVVLGLVTTGANARYASVPKDVLVRIPPSIDPCVAVCLCEIYLTAFQALHLGQRGNLRYRSDAFRGKSILILCGSSNLGHALIEVASAGGAEYCYALANEGRHEGIRHRGGIPLSMNPDQWLTLIGRQIHILVVVADSNGLHTDDVTPAHFKAVRDDGQVIFIGPPGVNPRKGNDTSSAPSGRPETSSSSPNPSRLMCKSLKGSLLERSNFFNLFDSWGVDPKMGRRDLEHLITMLEEERIRPVVLERVPLSKVARVHSILESRRVPGFIVCAPWIHEPCQQLLGARAMSTSSTDSSIRPSSCEHAWL